MRTFQAVIIFLLLNNLSNAQHYIKSFDNVDDNSGYSFHSNANAALHWGEAPRLENYLYLYKSTHNIKYLQKLIIHIKRIQERRDDNIGNLSPNEIAGLPNQIALSIECNAKFNECEAHSSNSIGDIAWRLLNCPSGCGAPPCQQDITNCII